MFNECQRVSKKKKKHIHTYKKMETMLKGARARVRTNNGGEKWGGEPPSGRDWIAI